jgi:hypothetical protein
MVNNVIRVVNYVIAARPSLLNFMVADTSATSVPRDGKEKVRPLLGQEASLAGLDDHQVRTWTSWHRWVTLAMLAYAFSLSPPWASTPSRRHPGKSRSTRNEIAGLFTTLLIQPARDHRHLLHWSQWRRRHQRCAQTCHYQHQDQQQQT